MKSTKRLGIIFLIVLVVLLIPFVAMQISDEVNWSLFDFAIAAILLSSAGLVCEFVLSKYSTVKQRVIFCGIVIIVLAIIWVELAVGIFGTPLAGS